MDYPPDAKIPIYNEKTYVKVLRLPKNVKFNFKNSELFSDNAKKGTESLLDIKTAKNTCENNSNSSQMNSNNIPNNLFNSSNSNNSNPSESINVSSPERINENKQKSRSNMNIINVESNIGFGIENIDFEKIGKKLQDNETANTNFSIPLVDIFPKNNEENKNNSPLLNQSQSHSNKNTGNKNISNPCNYFLIKCLNWED
jgi:hypothetical protein